MEMNAIDELYGDLGQGHPGKKHTHTHTKTQSIIMWIIVCEMFVSCNHHRNHVIVIIM